MPPPWSRRLLAKKNRLKETSAVNVHAFSSTERKNEIKGEEREKPGGKRWKAWRLQSVFFQWRRRPRRPPPSPLNSNNNNNNNNSSNNSGSAFVLALVFFSLGALLVAGLASSVLRSKAVATSVFPPSFFLSSNSAATAAAAAEDITTSYAPPKNWTSPPAAVRVVDGDTVVAAGIVVRLLGMDAPEDGQPCGRRRGRRLPWTAGKDRAGTRQAPRDSASGSSSYDCGAEATRALRGLVAGRPLRCERRGTDRYGRALARCYVSGGKSKRFFFFSFSAPFRHSGDGDSIDIGEWMLRRGHAVSYLGSTKPYLEAESAAKRERRGIWGGEFELPEVWREKRRREREAKAEKKRRREREAKAEKKRRSEYSAAKKKQQQKKKKKKKKGAKAKGSRSGRNSMKKKRSETK